MTDLIQARPLNSLQPREKARLLARSSLDVETVSGLASEILRDVKERGDDALLEYTARFDRADLKPGEIRVSEDEIRSAYAHLSDKVMVALEAAARNIEIYQSAQIQENSAPVRTRQGIWLKDIWRPVGMVGLYATRGLPSTCLMITVPGKVAGVPKMIACTPPGPGGHVEPAVLVALNLGGVTDIYRVGGAQAIAAMAYGTRTVPRVEKIIGPGNLYVTAAKLIVAGLVGIDLPAGPSEVLIYADDTAQPSIVVADLLSQLEHGRISASRSHAALVTTSRALATKVAQSLNDILSRDNAVPPSEENVSILMCDEADEAVEFVNEYAPEHLQIITLDPQRTLTRVRNAGSVFLGAYSPVAAGDYATGANHVLPTGGAAKWASGLSVCDYMKRITVQRLTRAGLTRISKTAISLAETEGLNQHAESIEIRLREDGQGSRQ